MNDLGIAVVMGLNAAAHVFGVRNEVVDILVGCLIPGTQSCQNKTDDGFQKKGHVSKIILSKPVEVAHGSVAVTDVDSPFGKGDPLGHAMRR